jgi:hypothetical protein
MSVPSRLNSPAFYVIAATLAMSSCHATDHHSVDVLSQYRTTANWHGLFEIRAEARKFLSSQPAPRDAKWQTLGPDIRAQVPRCAVPLSTRWAQESDEQAYLPSVAVTCERSVDNKYKKWTVFVDVFVPVNSNHP